MIFDKLVSLKISLDLYRNSKNPFKKILYYILLRTICKKVKTIKESIITFEILSEFQEFVNIADPNKLSNIIANEYDYSTTFAQEIIIKQQDIGNITILLRHKNKSIEIEYPFSVRYRVNRIYKSSINSNNEVIPDKHTIIINNSIRNYIYDFIVSYMKGEFDYEQKEEPL